MKFARAAVVKGNPSSVAAVSHSCTVVMREEIEHGIPSHTEKPSVEAQSNSDAHWEHASLAEQPVERSTWLQ